MWPKYWEMGPSGKQNKTIQSLISVIAVWFSFPGDIGGQMGLFIGASILTILEILDYIYEVCIFTSLWENRTVPWHWHKRTDISCPFSLLLIFISIGGQTQNQATPETKEESKTTEPTELNSRADPENKEPARTEPASSAGCRNYSHSQIWRSQSQGESERFLKWLLNFAPNIWRSASCDMFVNRQLMTWLNRTVHIQLQCYRIITTHNRSYSRTLLFKGRLFFSLYFFISLNLKLGSWMDPALNYTFRVLFFLLIKATAKA